MEKELQMYTFGYLKYNWISSNWKQSYKFTNWVIKSILIDVQIWLFKVNCKNYNWKQSY